jgi:hypothetical protein
MTECRLKLMVDGQPRHERSQNMYMWQLRVENEHYSVIKLLNKTRAKFNTSLVGLTARYRRSTAFNTYNSRDNNLQL